MEVELATRHQNWHTIVNVERVIIIFSMSLPSLALKNVRAQQVSEY